MQDCRSAAGWRPAAARAAAGVRDPDGAKGCALVHLLCVEMRTAVIAACSQRAFILQVGREVFGFQIQQPMVVLTFCSPALGLIFASLCATVRRVGWAASFESGDYIAFTSRMEVTWWYRTFVVGMLLGIFVTMSIACSSLLRHDPVGFPEKQSGCCSFLQKIDWRVLGLQSEYDVCSSPYLLPFVPTTTVTTTSTETSTTITTSSTSAKWHDFPELPELPPGSDQELAKVHIYYKWVVGCREVLGDPLLQDTWMRLYIMASKAGLTFLLLLASTAALIVPNVPIVDVDQQHFRRLYIRRSWTDMFVQTNDALLQRVANAVLLAKSGRLSTLEQFFSTDAHAAVNLPLVEPWSVMEEMPDMCKVEEFSEEDTESTDG